MTRPESMVDFAPAYNALTICIRAALYGWDNPVVAHMVERNEKLAVFRTFGV